MKFFCLILLIIGANAFGKTRFESLECSDQKGSPIVEIMKVQDDQPKDHIESRICKNAPKGCNFNNPDKFYEIWETLGSGTLSYDFSVLNNSTATAFAARGVEFIHITAGSEQRLVLPGEQGFQIRFVSGMARAFINHTPISINLESCEYSKTY